MNIERRSRDVYADYYEKTGINLTEEPMGTLPESLEEDAAYIYHNLRARPRKLIPRIQKLIKKYPNIPSLKNYLYSAYVLTGKDELAMRTLKLTIKKHPKYIFGLCAFIERIDEEEELKKHEHLLGTPRSILSLSREGKKIHISEFSAYQAAACHYEALTGDIEGAKERLRDLIDLGIDEEQLRGMARKIAISRMTQNTKKMKEEFAKEIRVKAVPKFEFEGIEKPPEVRNDLLLDLFYNNNTAELGKEQIDKVMALPREGLIKDLELIVSDAIRRLDFFGEQDFNDNTHEFLIHGLYFLGALKSEQSLEVVLDLLRIEEDFLEYWLGDSNEAFLTPTMYYLGGNQLEKLKDYVLEEKNVGFDRAIVATVVAQVAMHQPARREEVIDWFKTVLEYHLQHPENEGIIDSNFLMVCVENVTNIRANELLPLIRRLFEKDWIPTTYVGDLVQVEKEMEEPFNPYYKRPLPLDIYEFYSGEYKSRKEPSTSKNLDSVFNEDDPVEVLISKTFFNERDRFLPGDMEEESVRQPVNTTVRKEQKIGRNDPCECGSGKKYKHCCLRN